MDFCERAAISNDFREYIITNKLADVITYPTKCIKELIGNYNILYVDRNAEVGVNIREESYTAIPKCYSIEGEEALLDSGILSVQNQPFLNLKGKNVVIGIIDTGIDYQSAAFRNADGSSRILRIWDQTAAGTEAQRENGTVFYGRVYTKEEIDQALSSEDPLEIVPVTDENGHGTRVAKIAAGSTQYQGNDRSLQGMDPDLRIDADGYPGGAPEASLVIIKLKGAKQYLRDFYQIWDGAVCFQETDLLCAIDYLERFAAQQKVPMIIGLALGTNQGDHTGRSPLGETLNRISGAVGFVAVGGTGNEGNKRHHFKGNTTITENYRDMEIRVSDQTKGFVLEIWGELPSVYTIEIVSPLGERIPRVPIGIGQSQFFRFVLDHTELNVDYRLVALPEGAELIFLRFVNPSSGIWRIRVYGNENRNGSFHAWLPLTDFMDGDTYFLESDPDVTLTEPFCAQDSFCVSAYDAQTSAINISSGRGYNRIGIVKPDVAVAEDTYGSSGASALAMGAAALLMEWGLVRGNDDLMDGIKIRNYFILGAARNIQREYPNTVWGYGKLNVLDTLHALQIQ